MTFGELDEDGTIMWWIKKGWIMFSARSLKSYEA